MYVTWNCCGADTVALKLFRIINRAANREKDFANSDSEKMIKGDNNDEDDRDDCDVEVAPQLLLPSFSWAS